MPDHDFDSPWNIINSPVRITKPQKNWRVKMHKCPHCDYFGTHLKRHMVVHLGAKPFKCPHCDKSFSQSNDLKRHNRIHTDERPYKCPICDKGFRDVGTLSKHIPIHNGEKPHECVLCGTRFTQLYSLKKHISKKHKEDESMAEESLGQNNENELMNGYDQEDRVEEADGDQEDGDDLDQNGAEEADQYEEDAEDRAQNGEEEVEGDQEDGDDLDQNGIEEADWDQEEEDDPDQIEVQEADGDQEFEEDRDQNGNQNEENEDSRKRTPADGGAICPSCGTHIKYLRNLNRHLKACCPKRREEGKLLPMNPITARIKKQKTDGDQEDEDDQDQNQDGIEETDWDQDGEDDRDQNGEEEADGDQEDEEDPDQNEEEEEEADMDQDGEDDRDQNGEEEADGDQNEENNDSRKQNRSACRTPDGGVICPRCGIHLKIYCSLKRHLKMHCSKERIDEEDDRNKGKESCRDINDDRLTCQYCGKCYYRRGMLYQHQEQVHGISVNNNSDIINEQPAYQCPDCFKILSSKYCLEYHRKVGCRVKKIAESQHKCSQCEFTAIGKYDLGRHIQNTHHEQKSFKCYYCEKCFLRKYQCEEHMRTHTGEKPYKCHACGREYLTPRAMTDHLRLRRCHPKKPPTKSKDKKPTRKRDMKMPKREKIEIKKEKKMKKVKKEKKHDVSLIKLVGRPLF